MNAPEKIWSINNKMTSSNDMSAYGPQWVEYTRTDLSQAAVAAALEAAAVKSDDMATEWGKKREAAWRKKNATEEARVFDGMSLAALTVADAIRALITPAQHDALAAHVAAEVAKLDKWLRHEDDCKFLDIAVCDCGLEHTFSQIGAKP